MDYQSFKKDFELSGLTQKAYAQQAKISPSMVSYYLRRARESAESDLTSKVSNFESIKITDKSVSSLKITTPTGVIIELSL